MTRIQAPLSRRLFLLLTIASGPALPACSGDGDDESSLGDGMDAGDSSESGAGDTADGNTETGAGECGPTELCARSIDECGLEWELAQCEAWYADDAGCADFPSYVACNCQCINQPSCEEYNGCGSICFDDHC